MSIELLGTSHISPISAKQVRARIESGEIDIVAIELDHQRLHNLFAEDRKNASIWQLARVVGLSGALFAKLGQYVQKKLGGRIGMDPGEEMKTAVLAARDAKVKVALIDRPLQHTLKRFSEAFTFREKMRLLRNAFKFTRVKIDLRSVPDAKAIQEMLGELQRVSPALYNVLVHERNVHMSKALINIQRKFPEARILAVVGAGHVPGMAEYLNNVNAANQHDVRAEPA